MEGVSTSPYPKKLWSWPISIHTAEAPRLPTVILGRLHITPAHWKGTETLFDFYPMSSRDKVGFTGYILLWLWEVQMNHDTWLSTIVRKSTCIGLNDIHRSPASNQAAASWPLQRLVFLCHLLGCQWGNANPLQNSTDLTIRVHRNNLKKQYLGPITDLASSSVFFQITHCCSFTKSYSPKSFFHDACWYLIKPWILPTDLAALCLLQTLPGLETSSSFTPPLHWPRERRKHEVNELWNFWIRDIVRRIAPRRYPSSPISQRKYRV